MFNWNGLTIRIPLLFTLIFNWIALTIRIPNHDNIIWILNSFFAFFSRHDFDYLSLKRSKTKCTISEPISTSKFEIFDIEPDPFIAKTEKSLMKAKDSLKQEIEALIAKNGWFETSLSLTKSKAKAKWLEIISRWLHSVSLSTCDRSLSNWTNTWQAGKEFVCKKHGFCRTTKVDRRKANEQVKT